MKVTRNLDNYYSKGNFNAFIMEVAESCRYLDIRRRWTAIKRKILTCLNDEIIARTLSPDTCNCLEKLVQEGYLEKSSLVLLEKARRNTLLCPQVSAAGCIPVPLVDSCQGYVRDLQVVREECHLHGQITLDLVCVLLQRACRKWLGRSFFLSPDKFSASIIFHPSGAREEIDGHSYELPLFLALVSLLTGQLVPADISASGQLCEDGSIAPVKGLELKIAALERERYGIRRLLVSEDQEIKDFPVPLEVVRLKNVTAVLEYLFDPADFIVLFNEPYDLDAEVRNLKNDYRYYRLQNCIANAETIIISSGISRRPKELFTAYWYRGRCYCHLGKVEDAMKDFHRAGKLYERSGADISRRDYLSMLNNKGVVCKDVFRYQEAEEIFRNNGAILAAIGAENYDKAKNISSLSQLLSASGRHGEAIAEQRKALEMLSRAGKSLYRNYGYLANIYTRDGDFRRASRALAEARKRFAKERNTAGHDVFLDWYEAELRYRRICASGTNAKMHLEKLVGLAENYPVIADYSHAQALVYKFTGLALMQVNHLSNNEFMDKTLKFFEKQEHPMYRLLAASLWIERQIILASRRDYYSLTGEIEKIISSLRCQPDIRRFFKFELRDLSGFQKTVPKTDKRNARLLSLLSRMREKIPY